MSTTFSPQPSQKRAIVYIDGYNLYYGLRDKYAGAYWWLDLEGLSKDLLRRDMKLVAVKYFIAIKGGGVKLPEQEIYLRALNACCSRLQIFKGRFSKKKKTCQNQNCGHVNKSFEEKETDVNIACQILNDAYLDRFDYCYLVSGDSDLVPPLKILKEEASFQNKRVVVVCPPRRKSEDLCRIADDSIGIWERNLKRNLLPDRIERPNDSTLERPYAWRA